MLPLYPTHKRLSSIVLVDLEKNTADWHRQGLSVTVQVRIKHVTVTIAKTPTPYHTLKPINLTRLWAREELKWSNVQDAVRCGSVTRQYKTITLERQSPRRCATDKCCVRVA